MPTAISEITGQPVDTASEEWRHECECRFVLDCFPDKYARNNRLYGQPEGIRDNMGRNNESLIRPKSIAAMRGAAAADRIREGAMAIAANRRAAAKQ